MEAQGDKMIFFDTRYRICKYCGKRIDLVLGRDTDRMIGHLRKDHPDELEPLRNLYLQDIINISFNKN